jgi:hypothetical protein
MKAQFWFLFNRSAWAPRATVVAGKTVTGAAADSVRLVSVGSATNRVGHCLGHCSGFCSLGRRGVIKPMWWRLRQVSVLLWSLFARLAWAQPITVMAGT